MVIQAMCIINRTKIKNGTVRRMAITSVRNKDIQGNSKAENSIFNTYSSLNSYTLSFSG